tara:strand:- start:36 stop:2864 length:2829 start_codon:yes stop_codon:yes gene_type:complete
MILHARNFITPDSALGGKQIQRGLRFDGDNTYLNRTPSTAGSRSKWTWSAWIKRTKFGTAQDLYSAYDARGFYNIIRFGTDDKLNFQSNSAEIKKTNRVFRDITSWYHIVVVADTPNTTAADRIIIYVNGSRETLATDNYVLPSHVYAFNTTQAHTLGVYANGSSYNFDGYMADIHFRDGQALDPTYFGFTDVQTGMWLPKPYTGTFTNVNSNSLNDGTTWNSTYANAFNGTPTTSAANDGSYTGVNGTFTINFPGSGVVVNSSLQYQGYSPASSQSSFNQYVDIYVNGTERTCTIVSGTENGTHSAVHNIDFTGTMTSLRMQSKPTSNNGISQVIVDGEILINGLDARGNNSFHLDFIDNSGTTATTLGKDTSGNANNYTPNNFSVSAGAGKDSVTGSPTNNFCVMNVIDRDSSVTVSDGGLKVSNNNQVWAGVKGTLAVNSGKWYYEMKTENANIFCGWASDDLDTFLASPQDNNSVMSDGVLIFCDDGRYQLDTGGSGTRVSYSSALSANDVLGCAIDLDNDTAQFYKNGTALGSIDISSSKLATKHVHPYFISYYTSSTYTFNFGQQAFAYTPPAGYRALNSKNIATPVPAGVVRPQKHFDTLLYTGNGGTQSITGLEFQPDWVWLKKRNGTTNHLVFDSVRGTNKSFNSNGNGAEDTSSTNKLTSFNSDGFTLGSNASGNNNSDTYVAWCWKAGGAAVSNSDGSITSSVSVNEEAGFSIVTYTGTGSAATIGHGLGVTPDVLIVKNREEASSWRVFHHKNTSAPETDYLALDNTNATFDRNDWNDTLPTSTVFSIGPQGAVNNNNIDYVGYIFSEVEGYSKFGSYIGNGSSDGTFVHLGFRPAWLMVKNTSSTYDWMMFDVTRSPFNDINDYLFANLSEAEGTGSSTINVDFLSNGFKWRGSSSGNNYINKSGDTFIYMAFAEQPSGTMFGLDANAR